MPSSQPIHAQQTCLLPQLTRHAARYNSRTVAVRLSQPVLILRWTLTYIHSCAITDPADPADPALTSKPAHTCSPTIVTACMQNLLSQSHHRMCLHLIRLKMSQFSHVWGPPAPPPCMTCMSLAWPVRQHACSHCAKLQLRITSGCRDNRAPVLLPLSFPVVEPCGQSPFQ